MRIGIDAHFVGIRHGGNEHHFENLIRAMVPLRGDAELHVFSHRLEAKRLLPDPPLRLVELRRRSVFAQRGLEIPLLDRKLGLDVLHVPFNVLPVGRSKKVVTIHDLAFLHVGDTFDRLERKRMSLLTGFSARKADHIFTVSEYSRRDIVSRYRVPEGKVTVTYNAVDPGAFHPWPEERKAEFRRRRGLDRPFLLFVGTLQPRKNVLNLVRAFRAMGGGGDVRLVLVGRKGWIYDSIFAYIREHGLEDRVLHWEGVDQETLAGLYNTALGLAFPSIFEGFGMPILEAMACGCPVASSTATSMPEICGDAALAFDPADVAEMSDCLSRLAGDAALRRELAARGLANCARFSWDDSARIALSIYRRL